jgi:AcrR family transcriptional regulator
VPPAQEGSSRRYDSSGRRARAASTRRQIVAAAYDLFVTRGYSSTTIADIAAVAEVSAPTVYAGFGSKAGLLKTCIDVALSGDLEPVAVADRPMAQWVYDTDDPREMLGRYATMMGVLARRAAPIFEVLARAVDTDPDLAALLADLEGQRHRAAGMLAEAVADRGGLPAGRTVQEARDTVWILNAPELYTLLCGRRGWSHRRYVAWARNGLIQLVVAPPVPGETARPPRA